MVLAETLYYLSESGLAKLLDKLAHDNRVYLSAGEALEYHLAPAEVGGSPWQFSAVRAVEPLKSLLFAARQDVGSTEAANAPMKKATNIQSDVFFMILLLRRKHSVHSSLDGGVAVVFFE